MRSALPPPKSATDLLMERAETAGRKGEADSQPTLRELFADKATDAAALGFMLAQIDITKGPVLWISDRISRKEAGVICMAGLPHGIDVLRVDVSKPVNVLWAMEQGLGCSTLGAVVGEVWGDPPALDFTASKRLALRAEAHAVPAWLIRRAATANLSAARARWRVASLASMHNPDDIHALGQPLWQANLFRSRWGTPGEWVARAQDGTLHLDHRVEGQTEAGARYG